MASSRYRLAQALKITAGHMPAADTYFWSDLDGTGGTAGAGVQNIKGHHADEAIVDLLVSSFNATTGLVFRAQVMNPSGVWCEVDPPMILDGPSGALRFLTVTGGKVVILAAAAGQAVRIRVPCKGAKGVRFGVTPADGGAITTAACTASFELIDSHQSA